jgi:pSer/pThr/pTyr-binding forkhead associated (FHA) protein
MKSSVKTLGQFGLKCLDQRLEKTLLLEKKKVLLGSHESCDIHVADKSVSSYHAFICLKGEGFMIKDLYSEAGVFVNGKRVEEAFVNPGDVITLGTLSFNVESYDEDMIKVSNLDESIADVVAIHSFVELPPREGLTFIDGEYCDIKFDESNFLPLTEMPSMAHMGEYVELDPSVEIMDIAHKIENKRLEVISYVNGLMMDVTYIDLKGGDFYLSPVKKSANDIVFHTLAKTKIFTIERGDLRFFASDVVKPSVAWDKIDLKQSFFLTHGAEQISFRFVNSSTTWRGLPLFYRDREFFKQGAKIFAGVIVPLLLLLFISIPEPEVTKEEVAVIYTLPKPVEKAQEAQEKSDVKAEVVTSKTENSGHKETQQPSTKVEFAAASAQKKVAAKAASQPPAQAAPVTPVKAYEFKSSVAMGSLTADAPKINANGNGSKSALSDTTFNSGSSDSGDLVAGADIGVSKFNGSDKKGSGSASYGSRGLASKAGFDSSYLEPKTVVLGSMDPELLRRIVREYIPQFRHCYQQELIGNNDKIKGVIDLNFTISAEGKVSKYDIRAKDAQFSKKGTGCMGHVLGLIDFPKPKGGGVVDVRQPLNFFAETEKI